ncbi:hypothetical protein E2C01_102256 [Portunus trituberculatus]|uniref:Uncharacterized protein n=1 Tax=Portunus trituberculatus TaxID=210409 RepID=A0A5B7K7P2_PORTR|nr:hypothetical protein [Portunus trituberculatus]
MVVAHRHPPNHTGDHSHLNTTSGTRQRTVPLRFVTQQGGRTQNPGKCSQIRYTFPWNNKPVAHYRHSQTSSKPATPKGEHNSQTETVEHPEQPSNTRLNTVPGNQECACLPLLKAG